MDDFEKEVAMVTAQMKYAPIPEFELIHMLMKQQVQNIEVDDDTALRMKAYYPRFEDVIGKSINTGFKFTYDGDLWRVRQTVTPMGIYPPSVHTAALYERINEKYDGTIEEPVVYKPPMELEKDKYYTDGNKLYHCVNGTGQAVTHKLWELVAFVEEV